MNVQETLLVIEALGAAGATHFKSQDFEISLIGNSKPIGRARREDAPQSEGPTAKSHPVENKEATEKLQNLIKTLSMPPEQLVDQIFPDGAGGPI